MQPALPNNQTINYFPSLIRPNATWATHQGSPHPPKSPVHTRAPADTDIPQPPHNAPTKHQTKSTPYYSSWTLSSLLLRRKASITTKSSYRRGMFYIFILWELYRNNLVFANSPTLNQTQYKTQVLSKMNLSVQFCIYQQLVPYPNIYI